jgi:hypothetical protein
VNLNGGEPSTTLPLTYYATTPLFGPVSSFWVHAQFGINNPVQNYTYPNGILLVVSDASGIGRLAIRGTGNTGQIKISTIDASGTFTDLVTSALGVINFSLPNGNPTALDFFINYAVSGQVTVYCNGVNVCDTGPAVNVTTNSVTALAQVTFGAMNGNTTQYWSECIVQDTTTLGLALQTLPPLATGNTQAWTGNVGNIDTLSVNYADYNYTTSAGQLSEWTVGTTLPTGTWTIEAVVQAAAISRGSSGPQHFAWDVRTSSGTSYQSGTLSLSVGFAFYQYVWMTNPATSAAWTAGQLVNSGIESLA